MRHSRQLGALTDACLYSLGVLDFLGKLMSFNLVELVQDQLTGQVKGHVSKMLGNEADKADAALGAAVPGLLKGLVQSASTPSGADSLLKAVNDQDEGLLDNLGSMLGGNKSASVLEAGSNSLGSLFGSKGAGALSGAVSSVSGLSEGGTKKVMGMAAPMVMGVIKQKVMSGGLNASGLASMLKGQEEHINKVMPAGLGDQLSSQGFLSSITGAVSSEASAVAGKAKAAASNAANAASNTAASAKSAVAGTTSGGSSNFGGSGNGNDGETPIWKKILPILGVLVLGWIGLNLFGGKDKEVEDVDPVAAVTTATEDAKDAASDTATAATETAENAVEGAKDAASDTAAAVTETAENAVEGAKDAASDTAAAVTETAENAVEGAKDAASDTAAAVTETAENAVEGAEEATAEATESAETAVAETTETAEATESEEATETAEATESEEATETAEATESEEATETAETTESEEATETAEATESEEATETAEATESEAAASSDTEVDRSSFSLGAISRKFGGIFGTTGAVLGGVSDADSATAALPKLEAVSGTLDGVLSEFDAVPEAARGPLSRVVSTGIAKLTPVADTVLNKEGVGDILGGVVGPMMEKLNGIAQ